MVDGKDTPAPVRPKIPERLALRERDSFSIRTLKKLAEGAKKSLIPVATAVGVAWGGAQFTAYVARPWTGHDPDFLQELEDKISGAYKAKERGGRSEQTLEWWKRWQQARKKRPDADPLSETRWGLEVQRGFALMSKRLDQVIFWPTLLFIYWATSGFIRRRVESILEGLKKGKAEKADIERDNEVRTTVNDVRDCVAFLDRQTLDMMNKQNTTQADLVEMRRNIRILLEFAHELAKRNDIEVSDAKDGDTK